MTKYLQRAMVVTMLTIIALSFFGKPVEAQAVVPIDLGVEKMPTWTKTPTPEPTPAPKVRTELTQKERDAIARILRFVSSYRGKLTRNNVTFMVRKCGIHNAMVMVAISVPETQMGRNSKFGFNYWSWNRFHKYPNQEALISDICKGLDKRYSRLISPSGVVSPRLATCYVNGCRGRVPTRWMSNVQWAYSKME